MALTISALQIPMGESNVNSVGFRNLLENHIGLLQKDISTQQITLNPHDEHKWTGDLYGLLIQLSISQDLWWLTLRLNDLHSPIDYQGNLKVLLVPSINTVQVLLTRYLNTISLA